MHSPPAHWNRIELSNAPDLVAISIYQGFEPQLEVVDARDTDKHPHVDVDHHVNDWVESSALCCCPVDRVDVDAAETGEADLCNLLVAFGKPECKRAEVSLVGQENVLGSVGEVWNEERPMVSAVGQGSLPSQCHADRHDAVDNKLMLVPIDLSR